MKSTILAVALIVAFGLAGIGITAVGQAGRAGDPPATAPATRPVDKMAAAVKDVGQGALRIVQEDGAVECPLKHTDVKADIAGFVARVKVTQTFANPTNEKIEAIYVFPLPHKSAVDDMTMVIGQRRIVGLIKRRVEARQIYEQALQQGMTAALLEQERPNIFTQSVGNIEPGQEINIEISYVDVLEYDLGSYEFHFPMVVGPRYIPGSPTSSTPPVPAELQGKVGEVHPAGGGNAPAGTGWAPDTTRVPDASRITPPVLKPGLRNGHDISLSVALNAGVPVQDLTVANHEADIARDGVARATVKIKPEDSIPNKDFVLKYAVTGKKPEMAVLTHADATGKGYFLMMVQPKEDERLTKSPPREIVFLIDVSGSMSGRPTAKVIDAMENMLKLCRAQDTLQVITFAGSADKLFPGAVPANQQNIEKALHFTDGLKGGGGTEMLKGVRLAIDEPVDKERVRIVVMLTDGFIGNEKEIIEAVGKGCGDKVRFWCIGIGSGPNKFLLDGVAKQGGGMAKTLGLDDDTKALTQEIMTRIQRAQLANVKIDFGGLKVFETYPARIPELWAGRPIILFGRYDGGGEAKLTISGDIEGEPASWPLTAGFPANAPDNGALAAVWARQKIEDLMQSAYYGDDPAVEESVTAIALQYKLMSQYTSFVAVDQKDLDKLTEPVTPPRRMLVPVPIPAGTRFEGFFGGEQEIAPGGRLYASADRLIVEGKGERTKSQELLRRLGESRESLALRGGGWGYGPSGNGRIAGKSSVVPAPSVNTPRIARERILSNLNPGPGASPAATPKTPLQTRTGDISISDPVTQFDWRSSAAAPTTQPAMAKVDDAQDAQKAGRLLEARTLYTRAYLAALSLGAGNGSGALADLERINDQLVAQWTKAMPALGKPLDLVIRDKSLAEALAVVAKSAEVKIDIAPGSLNDATTLLGAEPRIDYLDLRRATVAQALDWLTRPARLEWVVADNVITVRSARRAEGKSAWVYDVAMVSLPDEKEITETDYQKRMTQVQSLMEAFISGTRKALKLSDTDCIWYGPGQLLIFADRDTHAAAGKLFADLADPKATLDGDIAALRKVTAARAESRQESAAALTKTTARNTILARHDAWSWALLSAANQGKLDTEALTQLQIAWKSPGNDDLVKDPAAGLLLARSAWTIAEASRAMPKETELADLAKEASAVVKPLLDSPAADANGGWLKPLYAALALREDSSAIAKAKSAFAALKTPEGTVANALLGEGDAKALATLDPQTIRGADMTVLAALASRRTGGAAWDTFRGNARELLKGQPLPGEVVVLIQSLSGEPSLHLAKR